MNVVMPVDLPSSRSAARLIPGAYERNALTYRQPGSIGTGPSDAMPAGSSSMDAATIAEREREGGGARRPAASEDRRLG
jgi:hypothetical protein